MEERATEIALVHLELDDRHLPVLVEEEIEDGADRIGLPGGRDLAEPPPLRIRAAGRRRDQHVVPADALGVGLTSRRRLDLLADARALGVVAQTTEQRRDAAFERPSRQDRR